MDTANPSLADLAPAGKWDGFAARLRKVEVQTNAGQVSLTGHFYYLAFREGEPTLTEFVEFLYWQLIPFCLPRDERRAFQAKFSETGNDRYQVEPSDKAKALFITAKQSQKSSGEPGELVLFMLLEAALGAPQIACKMYLKTAKDMPVHGSDAVHALYDANRDALEFIWGESKLYQSLPTALDKVCESLTSFLDKSKTTSSREHDVAVVLRHLNIPDASMREALLKYFDPYEEQANRRAEAFACLVGFDFPAYELARNADREQIEEHFRQKYIERIGEALKLFEAKLVAAGLTHLRFYFFLLPFPSVEEFRNEFFRKLGVSAD